MDKGKIIKSIAYCGLICEFCHQADECNGCKSENNICGKYLSEAGCFQRSCCIEQNIVGCWECDNFPCNKDMYSDSHPPKVKTFALCIREDGAEKFVNCVLNCKEKGLNITYRGDLDSKTQAEILKLLRET